MLDSDSAHLVGRSATASSFSASSSGTLAPDIVAMRST